jgi:hypothetical protein
LSYFSGILQEAFSAFLFSSFLKDKLPMVIAQPSTRRLPPEPAPAWLTPLALLAQMPFEKFMLPAHDNIIPPLFPLMLPCELHEQPQPDPR